NLQLAPLSDTQLAYFFGHIFQTEQAVADEPADKFCFIAYLIVAIGFDHCLVRVERIRFLGQVANACTIHDMNLARVGHLKAHEQLEQCCLTCAVWPDEHDACSRRNHQVQVMKQTALTKRFCELCDIDYDLRLHWLRIEVRI